MKCIDHTGRCHVAAGECERDGECYLWRCENPHAPQPAAAQDSAHSQAATGRLPDGQQQPASAADLDILITAARSWA